MYRSATDVFSTYDAVSHCGKLAPCFVQLPAHNNRLPPSPLLLPPKTGSDWSHRWSRSFSRFATSLGRGVHLLHLHPKLPLARHNERHIKANETVPNCMFITRHCIMYHITRSVGTVNRLRARQPMNYRSTPGKSCYPSALRSILTSSRTLAAS